MKATTSIDLCSGAQLPFTASAQGSDAAYCAALTQQYQKYVIRINGRTRASSTAASPWSSASPAITAAGISCSSEICVTPNELFADG